MLPDRDHSPAKLVKPASRLTIAGHVTRQLVGPPVCVCFGLRAVLRTTVPKAAVHEDRYAASGERNVDAAPFAARYRVPDPIPKASRVKKTPEGEFRGGVADSLLSHSHADASRRCNRARLRP